MTSGRIFDSAGTGYGSVVDNCERGKETLRLARD
jgi:hypothetical protein